MPTEHASPSVAAASMAVSDGGGGALSSFTIVPTSVASVIMPFLAFESRTWNVSAGSEGGVTDDAHEHLSRCRVLGEGERARLRDIVRPGNGRAVGRGVVDGDGLVALGILERVGERRRLRRRVPL